MRHQGGTCGPALLRFLRVCLLLQSNMSSLPYYYIIIGGIQWFKVLGGLFCQKSPLAQSIRPFYSLLFSLSPLCPNKQSLRSFIYRSDALRHLFTFSENAAVSQRGRLNKLKYKKSMYVHLIALKRGGCQTDWPRHCS